MQMKTMQKIPVAAVISTLLAAGLSAPAAADGGVPYVGVNLGTTLSTYSTSDLNNALIAASGNEFTIQSASLDKPKGVWWADAGYMVKPYVGVEASYLDLQTLKYHASGTETSLATVPATAKLDIESRGPTLALLGVLPFWDSWGVDGRVGVYLGKTSTSYSSTSGTNTGSGSESTTAASVLLGVGCSYSFSTHLAVRADLMHVNHVHEPVLGQSFNVNLLTGGIIYAF